MSIITVFSGKYCQSSSIIDKVVKENGYKCLTDEDIVKSADAISGMGVKKIKNAFKDKASIFNTFTHEKERALSFLKLAVSNAIKEDNLLISGYAGLLVPKTIHHVLRVCLISEMKYRVEQAKKEDGLTEKEALDILHKDDEKRSAWVNNIYKTTDPWDAALYDIVIPVNQTGEAEIIPLINEYLSSDALKPTVLSKQSVKDFELSAEIEVALAKEGHSVEVLVYDGKAVLTINKNVMLLSRLEDELKNIVGKVPGVTEVKTRVGKEFYQADTYRRYDFKMPSKVLLVDDEREFVQTLSERLMMREMGSAVVYDGESALEMVDQDEPEVMILDLNMPGIDGIEVLRRVKRERPQIEVIILTGHGSEDDRKTCMDLGAFAYLNKPVDIDVLSDYLKQANDKINAKN